VGERGARRKLRNRDDVKGAHTSISVYGTCSAVASTRRNDHGHTHRAAGDAGALAVVVVVVAGVLPWGGWAAAAAAAAAAGAVVVLVWGAARRSGMVICGFVWSFTAAQGNTR
jgi:hypothetical protein